MIIYFSYSFYSQNPTQTKINKINKFKKKSLKNKIPDVGGKRSKVKVESRLENSLATVMVQKLL